MKRLLLVFIFFIICSSPVFSQAVSESNNQFAVRGFHLDLRIQVMPMPSLRAFAKKLSDNGINTLIMEWEGTYPFEKHPLIPNRYAYTKTEIVDFIKYCNSLGIDVIPLQQSFGHVEYILRNEKYKDLREDQKDYSQVCPLQTKQDSMLFSDLYAELASTHTSKYIHIGGDETYLLGHDARCKAKVEKEGKSKLYIDYIRMLCNIVIKMGKKPVLWADIALKYPEAINLLPKGTILIDWNYGWDMNNFGEHQKLVESGYEIWGAPAIRSSPDNYYLIQWEKHFKNIRDFIPVCRKLKYSGIVMTSWSTSGAYSAVFENEDEITDLYAIRRVYPISGFNMLIAGYFESLKLAMPLDIEHFVTKYSRAQYSFDETQAKQFWQALKVTPYTVHQGKVQSPRPLSIDAILDSTLAASATLHRLNPLKNKNEFEQYRIMTDIRVNYLQYEAIEEHVNAPQFTATGVPAILSELKKVIDDGTELDKRFNTFNKDILYPAELAQENESRGVKARILYDRLSRKK